MAKWFDSISEEHSAFIDRQKVFFTASGAPGKDQNLSPKGIFPLKIMGREMVAVLDLYGSGNRTAEDIANGSPVTLMFCSFEENPQILRLFCDGKVISPDSPEFDPLFSNWNGMKKEGVRQIFVYKVRKVQTSCGYGVPVMEYKGDKGSAKMLTSFAPKTKI